MCSVKEEFVCRACLTDTDSADFVSIFKDDLRECYERCTALDISQDDSYPKYLCRSCFLLIESFNKFRNECIRSQHLWMARVNSSAAAVESDIDAPPSEDPTAIRPDTIKTEIDVPESDQDNNYDDHLNSDVLDESLQSPPPELPKRTKKKYTKRVKKQNRSVSFMGECDKCNKSFYYKASLIKHVNTTCGLKREPQRCLKITTKPHPTAAFFCGLCDENLASSVEVKKHLEHHQASNILDCKLCDYAALDFADLFGHRYSHQPAGAKSKKTCFLCSKSYRKTKRLEFHFRGAHLNKIPGLCRVCKKGFNNYSHFLGHTQTHTGLLFSCNTCEKSFKFERYLRRHLLSHSEGKMFMCHSCGFRSRRASGIRSHHFRHHTPGDRILCNHCGKKFKNSVTLREHMLRVNSERAFPCSVCGKAYRSEKEMLHHFKWHKDDKPYTCDICGSSYKAKAHLKCHMRVHTGERPYTCETCKMCFMSSNVLKHHIRTHTGEKPHSCNICGRKFAAKNNLTKHIRIHKAAFGKLER